MSHTNHGFHDTAFGGTSLIFYTTNEIKELMTLDAALLALSPITLTDAEYINHPCHCFYDPGALDAAFYLVR